MDLPSSQGYLTGKQDRCYFEKEAVCHKVDGHLHSVIRQAALPAAYSVGLNGIV